MSLFNNAITGAAGQQGYTISRSVRLRSSASAYFNRTPASASNQKTWTWSAWVKRGSLSVLQTLFGTNVVQNDSQAFGIYFGSDNTIGVAPWTNAIFTSSAVFRDPSAWYHIVVAFDSTQATATNRIKVYVNGVNQTGTYPLAVTQNANYAINQAGSHRLGDWPASGFSTFDGYLTEVNFIDGQALTPSSFGTTNALTGVWQPAKYTGTYGTNGFYLNFSDNSNNTATTIGKDYSGNGNNWTPNNISVTAGATYDSMLDVPTLYADGGNGRGNYSVMSPLDKTSTLNITDGNLKTTATTGWCGSRATFSYPSTGKYYWEATCISRSTGATAGILSTSAVITGDLGAAATGYVYNSGDGNKYNNGTGSAYGATWTTNDVIGVAWDADAGTLSFYKNGTSQGNAYTGLSGTFSPAMGVNGTDSMVANFGQRPFSYTPPTGYVALNTYNLPASTITNGAGYMAATLYTGNGTSQSINNSVNGVSFQPDFVWYKDRSVARDHALFDVTRGALDLLSSNTTGAASSVAGTLTSFNSNGYSIGSTANANGSGETYVGWQWKAGGTGSSNTSGSITSTVSVGATQGFSVVTYTATAATGTIGHGLGVAPSMIITARRSSGGAYWGVYHQSLGASQILYMQVTNAATADLTTWNATSPTSSVFSVGNSAQSNNPASATYVAYCFAAVKGFSAFGSYTGNGSADGTFVYLGFRPRFVLFKRTDTTNNWLIIDSVRGPYNSDQNRLFPNLSNAEDTSENFDLLSNGFKLRDAAGSQNASGGTYIYAAFAENPFKNALAR